MKLARVSALLARGFIATTFVAAHVADLSLAHGRLIGDTIAFTISRAFHAAGFNRPLTFRRPAF